MGAHVVSKAPDRAPFGRSVLQKLGKLGFGFGRDAAKALERAKQLRDAGEFDAALALLAEPPPEVGKVVDPKEFEVRHDCRLVRAECQAAIGVQKGHSELARQGIRTLVSLPAVNVNALRDSVLRWPEKLARAEDLLTTMLAPEWHPHVDKRELLPELQALASAWNLLLEPASARRVCVKGLAALGEVSSLLVLQAEAELGIGAPRDALACLARTIRSATPLESSNLALAVLADIGGLDDAALANEAEVLTGELLGRLESWGRALPLLQKAVEERFDDAGIPAVEALLIACARSRHFTEFETLTERFLNRELPPQSLGRLEKEITEALPKYPDRPRLRGILGILCLRSQRTEEGLAHLVSAIKANPPLADSLVKLVRAGSGPTVSPTPLLLQLARSLLEAGSADASAVALAHVGSLPSSPAETERAITLAREICRDHPEIVGARIALGGMLLRENRLEEAAALARETVERSIRLSDSPPATADAFLVPQSVAPAPDSIPAPAPVASDAASTACDTPAAPGQNPSPAETRTPAALKPGPSTDRAPRRRCRRAGEVIEFNGPRSIGSPSAAGQGWDRPPVPVRP